MVLVRSLSKERFRAVAEATAVALLLVLYASLALTAIQRKSVTFDELSHLTSGYSRWQTGDYQLYPQNGLAQEWAALALLPGQWRFPSLDEPPWSSASAWHVGQKFFYRSGNDADVMLFRARAMVTVLALALGFLVYAWARSLFGRAGGLIGLVSFATCPGMLAHGPLVTADLAATLFFTASIWALWRVLHRVTARTVLISGLAMSGLFLSKMSAVILMPFGLVLAVFRLAIGRPLTLTCRGRQLVVDSRRRQAVLLVGLALLEVVFVWLVIWAFYGFRYEAVRPERPGGGLEYVEGWPEYMDKPGFLMHAIVFARENHLLPETFLFSFADAVTHSEVRSSFLNGEHTDQGLFLFFPYCLLVKTSPALLGLLGLAAAGGLSRLHRDRTATMAGVYDIAPLLIFLAVYWAFALTSHLNIGHRHLLPTYPAMYILAGGSAALLRRARPNADALALPAWDWRAASAIGICLLAAAAEAARTWPHYLAYFNFLAGGPSQGYKHLVDSSLDWGQDLKELAKWLEARGLKDGTSPVYLAYFGTAVPEYYGIRATTLPCFFARPYPGKIAQLSGGTYCISASMLQNVFNSYIVFCSAWGRKQENKYGQVLLAGQHLEKIRSDPEAVKKFLKLLGLSTENEFRNAYEEARFARLCAFLRHRRPDGQVGYSILIYQLTDADAERALFGPAPYENVSEPLP